MHILISMNNVVASKSVTVRRFERGESYVQFTFEGAYAKMRNTLLERDEMTRSKALDRIANLEADGWVEVDAC
jgi:hypothetical protein